jgi:hypothetical protein
MNPLKKLVADRLKTQVSGPHPDAEALSAFSENALPVRERETVLQHLSACSECRNILFLAAPIPAETHQVFSGPKWRPHFAMRWGTLAACVVIAAVFLVSRHQAPRTQQVAKSGPQTENHVAPAAVDAIVAADKTPDDLRALRDRKSKVALPATTNGHAEPKHITAKPEGYMSFGDSGEVQLKEPATPAGRVEQRAVQELSTTGRNVAEFKQVTPSPAPSNIGGPVSKNEALGGVIGGNANWSAGPVANTPAQKDLHLYGYVAGTVFDASGAVVANAKVTAIGPVGAKTAISDQGGKYSLDQLKAGNYQLNFDAPGFRQVQLQQVAVLANKPANVDVKLTPGSTSETVEVAAAAPSIEERAQQTIALPKDQQQQSANQVVQVQDLAMGAAVVNLPKAATKKGNSRTSSQPVPALAKALTFPVWQWSLSAQGMVQRSSDNGKTWQPVSIAAGSAFRAVSSLLNHIWAGGKAGVLYHSADSGQHWTQVIPSAAGKELQADITQVQLVDSQHIVLTTANSETWATADGGQTWSRK